MPELLCYLLVFTPKAVHIRTVEIFIQQSLNSIKLELTPLEGEFKTIFSARNDVTAAMAARIATAVMAVKWRHNLRNLFVCSSFIPQNL
jgi:hypothetical protein